MKSHTEYLTFNVPARMDFINITSQVEAIVRQSGIQEGLLLCNAMHITASVFINDDEPGLHEDYKRGWSSLHRSTRHRNDTSTTAPAKTMPTPITNARSWAARLWWRSQRGSWISAPGSRSFTESSTAVEPRGCSSR